MGRLMGCAPNLVALVAWLCLLGPAVSADPVEQSDEITLEWRQIFVKVTNGPTFSLMVEPDEIVMDLKRDIIELEGMPDARMKILAGNVELNMSAKLNEHLPAGGLIAISLDEERNQHTIKFNVTTLDGRQLPVETQFGNTVVGLKDNITQWTGISRADQRLLLGGKELKDERKLLHYDVRDGTLMSLGRPLEECRQVVSIDVKTLNGAAIKVELNLADTVARLKEKIRDKTGIPAGVQRLFADERVITGEDHLCDLGLVDGSTVYMALYSTRITSLDQVARLQEPPVARPMDPHKAPIFREAETAAESVQRDRRSASFYKDARNWVAQTGPRSGWVPDLFIPIAHLAPNPDDEKSIQHHHLALNLFSRPDASESERMEAVIFRARIKLSSALRPYRVAANLTTVNQPAKQYPGITLGGGSTELNPERLVPLGADVNNWAPDAFSDSDVMRLFEVSGRVRQVLARGAQTGEGTLSIASQSRINRAILYTYLEALAGYPPLVEHNQAREDEICGVCMDDLTAESAIKLTCEHVFHSDCIIGWATKLSQAERFPSCPFCRQRFMFSYEALGKAELQTPELQANRDDRERHLE